MHVLVGALVGALVSALIVAGVALWRGRRPALKDLLLAAGAGAVGGAITAATLGLGAGAASATLGRQVAAFSAGGAVAGGLERTGHNAVEGRPLGEGVATSTAIGAAGGAIPVVGRGVSTVAGAVARRVRGTTTPALEAGEAVSASTATRAATDAAADLALPPPAAVADAAPRVRGFVEALGGEAAPARPAGSPQPRAPPLTTKSPAVEAGLTAVHPAPPAWLQARMADTVAAVRRGVGPEAAPADVERFLVETYEHVREVNALLRALGTRARDLPAAAPDLSTGGGQALRGVHDFGERASVRRVEELIARLRREPVVEDGVVLPVPEWLARLPAEARRAGESTIDVGKLSPHVAAGLARAGKPDPFAIRLHNLSAHHQKMGPSATGRPSAALVEEVADRVNAMRQVRVYRKRPIPFERIEQLLLDDVRSGALPPEAEELVRKAVEAQRALERSGEVTPYYLLEG